MFKLYSKGCQYALRALAYVVAELDDSPFQAKDVCEKVGIPEPFTRKIFQALVQGGFLKAHRGPGGGYTLTRPPEETSLLFVIKAIEGEDTFDHCVMGFPECDGENPCPMHHIWVDAKKTLAGQLESSTLSDMANVMSKRGHTLKPGPAPKG